MRRRLNENNGKQEVVYYGSFGNFNLYGSGKDLKSAIADHNEEFIDLLNDEPFEDISKYEQVAIRVTLSSQHVLEDYEVIFGKRSVVEKFLKILKDTFQLKMLGI